MNKDLPVFKIIDELCEELQIETTSCSFGLIKKLRKDGKVRNIIKYMFDLNSYISVQIANDKYATYEILKGEDIPVIEHTMIFNPKTRKDYVTSMDIQIAKALFEKYNKEMVIKANNSYQGKEVFLVKNKEEIEQTILGIFDRGYDSVSLCPFEYLLYEYRVVILDEKALFCYRKDRPVIIGDGKKSLGDYVEEFNIKIPDVGLDLSYVPKKGERISLNWKFNLSGGALPEEVSDKDIKCKIEEIAIKAAKAINIRFATVDIVQNVKDEFKVMEVNATVCMNKFSEKYENGYEIAKDIYRKALEKMW